jgi:hypothetical protein
MDKLIWYVKQLFPLLYVSTFTEEGQRRLCIWRQWFGCPFDVRYFNLAG